MGSARVSRAGALAAVSVLLAVLALAGQRLAGAGAAEAPPPAPLEEVVGPAARPALVVHVVGAVRRPGLYRLREGARVADAVARAGGATRLADLAGLNLAAPLVDGTQVVVPSRPEPAAAGVEAPAAAVGAAPPAGRTVSLSSATAEELDALPGVGPVTAQRIVEHRAAHGPFRSVDELDAVPGIGPAKLEQLRELVTP